MEIKLEVPRDINEDKRETERIDRILFIGLTLIIILLPLIMRAKLIDYTSPTIDFDSISSSGLQGDVFTYYKFVFLFIMTCVMFLLFLYRTYVLSNSLKYSTVQMLFGLFMLLVALSAITSNYTSLSLFGMYNRHDGALTTILVILLFFIAANLNYSNKRLMIIAYAFTPVVIVNFLLGILTFYGINLLERPFVQNLIFPASIGADAMTAGSRLQTTINNPNYVSGFAAMLTIMYLSLSLFIKQWYHKVIFLVLSIISFIMMLTSMSQSGFLALAVSIFILVVYLIKHKNFKITLPIFALVIIFFIGSILFLSKENHRVWDETFGLFKIENPFIEQSIEEPVNKGNFTSAVSINLIKAVYANEHLKIELPVFPESGISAGSGRLYIWDRTIDLILQRPLLGHGMDTILYTFPQYEPEKQAGLRTMTTMVDKPHNIYLGIAYGSGVVALIAFLVGVIYLLLKSVIHVWNKIGNEKSIYVVAFILFIIAYLVQGLANDNIIGVLPLFWVIMGVMLSIISNKDLNNLKE